VADKRRGDQIESRRRNADAQTNCPGRSAEEAPRTAQRDSRSEAAARVAQWSRVVAGGAGRYREIHRPGVVWPELIRACRSAGFKDYSIFMRGEELFATFAAIDANEAARQLATDPVFEPWMRYVAPIMDVQDPLNPWQELERVFYLP
jgi:L-rhamnose mutarotase